MRMMIDLTILIDSVQLLDLNRKYEQTFIARKNAYWDSICPCAPIFSLARQFYSRYMMKRIDRATVRDSSKSD
jgi:hypothetical protein